MLLYRLDFSPQKLLIKIQEKGSSRILYLSSLKALAKEEDREALVFLTKLFFKQPNVSRAPDTTPLGQIEISMENSLEALQLLSKTGRLYFHQVCLQGEWSFPSKIYWKGEENGPISAVLQWKGQEIPLEECENLSSLWALWKHFLFPIITTVSWKYIELFLKGKVVLQGAQKKKFLEEEPPILWLQKPAEKPMEVLPELHLSDATGCFANLWMHYGDFGTVAFEDFSPTIQGKMRLKKNEEDWEKDLLEAGFLKKQVGRSHYYCAGDKVHETLCLLLDLGWRLFSAQGKAIVKQTSYTWDIREEKGSIAIRGKIQFQKNEISLLPSLVQNRSLWVDLNENSVGLLDRKKLSLLPEGHWEEDAYLVKKASIGAISEVESSLSAVHWEENLEKLAQGLKEGACLELSPPGPNFQGKLLPFQQKGVDWLIFLQKWGFSGLLADEMGLGKTVQVLAFFSRVRTNLPILVVAPSSLLHQWKQELFRFLPDLPVYVHAGPERLKSLAGIQGVVITSYAILRLDEELLSCQEFEVIVLDESNAIKTASSQTARSALRLKGRFKVSLSGTPIENSKEELVSQFKFLNLGVSSSDLETLKKQTKPFILRRKKKDVEIDLPEKMDLITWVEMNEAQSALYESYLSDIRQGVLKKIEKEGLSSCRMEVLEKILRLRQICLDPRLVGSDIPGSKLELLLEDIENRKVLIYSQFTSMLELVAKALKDKGVSYFLLDGSTSSLKRQEMVQQFQEDPNISVFLLSLKAGGVGLNLTAADYVLLLDPWWNEAVEMQAIARVHRIGQKKTVIAKRYLTPNSIEEKMLRLKEKKQALAELLLDGEAFNWTEEDLLHLLT